jgi:hypothetical protein
MRLTALRQSLSDIFRPENSKQSKPKPKPPNNLYPQLLGDCKPVSREAGKCRSTRVRTAPYGGAVQGPRKPTSSSHLSELTTFATGTCKHHLFLVTKPNKNVPIVLLPTDTQPLTETSRAGRPGSEMRPRDGARISARNRPLAGWLCTSPQHASYSAMIREQTETHHPGKRDSGKRLRTGEATKSMCPPSKRKTAPSPNR